MGDLRDHGPLGAADLVPSFVVVAYEESGHYVEAAAVTGVAVLVGVYLLVLPGLGWSRRARLNSTIPSAHDEHR